MCMHACVCGVYVYLCVVCVTTHACVYVHGYGTWRTRTHVTIHVCMYGMYTHAGSHMMCRHVHARVCRRVWNVWCVCVRAACAHMWDLVVCVCVRALCQCVNACARAGPCVCVCESACALCSRKQCEFRHLLCLLALPSWILQCCDTVWNRSFIAWGLRIAQTTFFSLDFSWHCRWHTTLRTKLWKKMFNELNAHRAAFRYRCFLLVTIDFQQDILEGLERQEEVGCWGAWIPQLGCLSPTQARCTSFS